MLAVIACLAGVLAILVVSEILWKYKILRGEYNRKFVHIAVGIFVAFWPWLISWRAIQVIALLMLVVNLFDRRPIFHSNAPVQRRTYGNILYAVAILLCSMLTDQKIFFALAIFHLSVADGLAAIVGEKLHKRWGYKIFHYTKTVIGTMAFWLVSVFILGIGLLFARDLIGYHQYTVLILGLPPILAILENAGGFWGTDNILVPLAVLSALSLAA
ncbi:hypothetical protein HYW35_01885 [Candidatus Saccharibacteria bacterium]|nr:hypothetical protein [Candidatus Saccharibacteria bacterium]